MMCKIASRTKPNLLLCAALPLLFLNRNVQHMISSDFWLEQKEKAYMALRTFISGDNVQGSRFSTNSYK